VEEIEGFFQMGNQHHLAAIVGVQFAEHLSTSVLLFPRSSIVAL